MNSLLKNWKLILIAACFVLIVGAWQYDHAAQYKRGRESMAVEISNRLKDAAIEKAKSDQVISEKYQSGKAVREEKERVRYVQVQKIVEKPVFRNVCLDEQGRGLINNAISDN
ncbi:MAG: hypothetical protein KHW43_05275 [Neisseria sp.]|nr:hypothetical protein [Neisseria sp.]